eukprot:4164208-Amphidinium_carterae.1
MHVFGHEGWTQCNASPERAACVHRTISGGRRAKFWEQKSMHLFWAGRTLYLPTERGTHKVALTQASSTHIGHPPQSDLWKDLMRSPLQHQRGDAYTVVQHRFNFFSHQ